MDYYIVCICGREWWFKKSEVDDNTYCTECGEILSVEEMIDDDGY